MVIGIFGENCAGKSTLANQLLETLNAEIYSGKDYLRLAKNAEEARKLFAQMLSKAMDGNSIIYVISEREDLSLLPKGAIRVLVSADLETIKERFKQRMHGNLPLPVAAMLERKHGCFDQEECHIHVKSGESDLREACQEIMDIVNKTVA